MTEEKYQIEEKANYICLLMLEDELRSFDISLSSPVETIHDWIRKLRVTRALFLCLNNINDLTGRLRVKNHETYKLTTRTLRKELEFVTHFRNKGIGHLDINLLKRAAQWSPLIFVDSGSETNNLRLADSHRAVIESCINSFLDAHGKQKIFGHEIDLNYPDDFKEFYGYLKNLVDKTLSWIEIAKGLQAQKIDFHSTDEIFELASIAGATNFNLKENSHLHFDEKSAKSVISKGLDQMKVQGVDSESIEKIRDKYKI